MDDLDSIDMIRTFIDWKWAHGISFGPRFVNIRGHYNLSESLWEVFHD